MKTRLLLTALLTLTGLARAEEFTGWLSDAKCAAAGKGGSAEHAACAKKCVEGGSPVVLVTADGKVYKIRDQDQDKVKRHAGQKATLEGKLEGDTLSVERGHPAQ